MQNRDVASTLLQDKYQEYQLSRSLRTHSVGQSDLHLGSSRPLKPTIEETISGYQLIIAGPNC
jgi:hypothetical protein